MTVVVLNGSPNPKGTVAKLLKQVISGLDNQVKFDWVDVYALNMTSCIGCMKCRAEGKCALPADDAHVIGKKIRNAEGIVIGTPTHWGNMSAPLKILLDRNVPVFIGEKADGMPEPRQKGKPAVIVSACTTPWPFNFIARESRGAVNSVKHVLHYGGYKILGTVVKPGMKKDREISAAIYKQAEKLGSKLSRALAKYIVGRRVDYKNTKIESYNWE
ncbi:MAG: flavodoxin family protein [Syntrophomonadaceae bacterium]|nr:flavodoxin family protein [Syntrophomonadaceae bacterium]